MPPGVQSGFGVHIGPPLLATITVLKSTDTSTNILLKIVYYVSIPPAIKRRKLGEFDVVR